MLFMQCFYEVQFLHCCWIFCSAIVAVFVFQSCCSIAFVKAWLLQCCCCSAVVTDDDIAVAAVVAAFIIQMRFLQKLVKEDFISNAMCELKAKIPGRHLTDALVL